MRKSVLVVITVLGISFSACARPSRSSSTSGSTTTSTTSGTRFNSNSSVTKTPVGASGNGSATSTGRRGGQANAQGSFQGTPVKGSAQSSGSYSNPNGANGSYQSQSTYKQGTLNNNANWNRTNAAGETKSGTATTEYNKTTGGSTTVDANGQTKTVELPPAGSDQP